MVGMRVPVKLQLWKPLLPLSLASPIDAHSGGQMLTDNLGEIFRIKASFGIFEGGMIIRTLPTTLPQISYKSIINLYVIVKIIKDPDGNF